MTPLVPDSTASVSGPIVVPAPSPARSPWVLSVVAAAGAGAAVAAAGAARGQLDPVAVLLSAAAVLLGQALAGLVARHADRAARDRWLAALDEIGTVCDARLESRRRSLRRLWPTSADLVEQLRRGEPPPVVGLSSLVVLGTGPVDSGIVLVGDGASSVAPHVRAQALRDRVADVPDGPLCVDAAGGVHVRGPALLARSLAGGYRAQLRHRGAPEGLVTWQQAWPAEPSADPTSGDGTRSSAVAGGGAPDVAVACVVEISSHGVATVVRRDGSACSVPVVPAWTSLVDAPEAPGAHGAPDAPCGSDAPDVLRRQPVRPERP
ncbi:hypothetical protein [Frigoribacterium sp. PvP032]|uniref:hypothetical protein n=1 Tax=Frigoribacterium sp. PvP032 TaxID=2806589 RepID=UPI001AE1928A|nr:hypothetical protein [Frigoribacterium sp. PvP032]MBP1190547.1 hypothetical protein [Frigoribacterium sp. PvP032]